MNVQPSLGYVKHTGTKLGLGVYASRDIKAGELVEACHILEMSTHADALPGPILNVVFDWSSLTAAPAGIFALPLGFGCIYNHANPACMRYQASEDKSLMLFYAVRDVSIDEELTVNYCGHRGHHESTVDDWFSARGIVEIKR